MLSKSNSLFIQSSQPHLDSFMAQHECETTSRLLIPCCETDVRLMGVLSLPVTMRHG